MSSNRLDSLSAALRTMVGTSKSSLPSPNHCEVSQSGCCCLPCIPIRKPHHRCRKGRLSCCQRLADAEPSCLPCQLHSTQRTCQASQRYRTIPYCQLHQCTPCPSTACSRSTCRLGILRETQFWARCSICRTIHLSSGRTICWQQMKATEA